MCCNYNKQQRWGARRMERFELVSPFQPTGDQPRAIEQLVQGIYDNKRHQVLLGATGTGKTFSI